MSEIQKISDDFDKEKSEMPANSNSEKVLIREKFVAGLNLVSELVESVVFKKEHLNLIEYKSRLETLTRELGEETAITKFCDAIECGLIKKGEHFQIPFLVTESDAPDRYEGSPDEDIEFSEYYPLEKACNELVKNHRNFLFNALSTLKQIISYDQDKKKFIKKIDFCLKPN